MAKSKKMVKPSTLLQPGNVVLLRTAVYHALGRVRGTYQVEGVGFVQLEDASFLGDTGRYHEATSKALSSVASSEIEPVGNGGVLDVQIGSIGDIAIATQTETNVK